MRKYMMLKQMNQEHWLLRFHSEGYTHSLEHACIVRRIHQSSPRHLNTASVYWRDGTGGSRIQSKTTWRNLGSSEVTARCGALAVAVAGQRNYVGCVFCFYLKDGYLQSHKLSYATETLPDKTTIEMYTSWSCTFRRGVEAEFVTYVRQMSSHAVCLSVSYPRILSQLIRTLVFSFGMQRVLVSVDHLEFSVHHNFLTPWLDGNTCKDFRWS